MYELCILVSFFYQGDAQRSAKRQKGGIPYRVLSALTTASRSAKGSWRVVPDD